MAGLCGQFCLCPPTPPLGTWVLLQTTTHTPAHGPPKQPHARLIIHIKTLSHNGGVPQVCSAQEEHDGVMNDGSAPGHPVPILLALDSVEYGRLTGNSLQIINGGHG